MFCFSRNLIAGMKSLSQATKIIFLTCDAYGVLPPVSKLTKEQAMYQYLSGYTAKVAGTELGIKEPTSTFSTCFGAPFLMVNPTQYAEILGRKMNEHNSEAYLVNTGWSGGGYGVGKRMNLKITRAIIDSILDGTINNTQFETMPIFGFQIPTQLANVPSEILNPGNAWQDKAAYDAALEKLAGQFDKNFQKFVGTEEGQQLSNAAGPKLGQ